MSELPAPDQLLASAIKFLIEADDRDSASVLLACTAESVWENADGSNWNSTRAMSVGLRGPAPSYKLLLDYYRTEEGSIARRVYSGFEALRPFGWEMGEVTIRAELIELDEEWLAELTELARGKTVNNQAAAAKAGHVYSGLRFQSKSELKIAEALDRAGVMYFPLCIARLNDGKNRVNREPDFLVCHGGKWGIIEVDGEPYHLPTRTVHDHDRDRLFKAHGVVVVEHFDSKPCYYTPNAVVKQFLGILENAKGA